MIEANEEKQFFGNNLEVGAYTYICDGSVLLNTSIGKFCSIATFVSCGLGEHPTNEFISTYPAFFSEKNSGCKCSFVNEQLFDELRPVFIGHDVWIGHRVIILNGITIGNGAIIGAGAIVTKDVPPYSIVAGTPAKILKFRFNSEQINFLEKFKWWDKDISWIKENAKDFNSSTFFSKHMSFSKS